MNLDCSKIPWVFLGDHGALLNEQRQWVKGPEKLRTQVTHVPLILRAPDKQFAGRKVSGFVQVPDYLPTFLGRLNLKGSSRITGEDLWPYVTGEKTNRRDHVISAYGYIASVRTKEWNYSAVWNREKYAGHYAPQLYNLKSDPQELQNVAERHPNVLAELQSKLDRYIASGWDITRGSFNEQVG